MSSHPSKPPEISDPFACFHPVTAEWFKAVFEAPTAPQRLGWPVIARGENALILAPTGTGKTLAAFLACLDRLMLQGAPESGPGSAPKSAKHEKIVEFTLHADGQVTDVEGLDKLSADEQAVWQEWLARFGGGASFPEKGIKPGEKWKAEEPIPNALLTGLSWDKESEYVNDTPCGPMKITPQGDLAAGEQPQEKCAVILTTAIMKQKSSQKDATPEDYKLHDLRIMGIAKGKNETITYISLKTGLVVRATDDANQSMNVIVAKTDGSNRVHYIIDAESHAQVLLLAEAPAGHP